MVDTFLFLGSLVQSRCGEGGTLQTNHTGVCSLCLSHIGPAPAHGAHSSGSRLLLQNRLRLALGCMHLPGLSHSGSGTQLDLRGADSVGPAFCALPRSEQLGSFGERSHCDLSPFPTLLLSFLGVQLAPLIRQMVTVQNPKKA